MGPCWGQQPYSDEATESNIYFTVVYSYTHSWRIRSYTLHNSTHVPWFLGNGDSDQQAYTWRRVEEGLQANSPHNNAALCFIGNELGGWCRSLGIWPHSLLWAGQRLGHKALQESFLLPLNCFLASSFLSSQALAAAVTSQIAVCPLEMTVLFHFRFIDRSSLLWHG